MPTTYKPDAISELILQFEKYDANDFGIDADSIRSRLRVKMRAGLTGIEMIEEAQQTVGINNPKFAEKFAQAVRRLSIP